MVLDTHRESSLVLVAGPGLLAIANGLRRPNRPVNFVIFSLPCSVAIPDDEEGKTTCFSLGAAVLYRVRERVPCCAQCRPCRAPHGPSGGYSFKRDVCLVLCCGAGD